MELSTVYEMVTGTMDTCYGILNQAYTSMFGITITAVLVTFVTISIAYRYVLSPALRSDTARKPKKNGNSKHNGTNGDGA